MSDCNGKKFLQIPIESSNLHKIFLYSCHIKSNVSPECHIGQNDATYLKEYGQTKAETKQQGWISVDQSITVSQFFYQSM
jgi:hypothetical protein